MTATRTEARTNGRSRAPRASLAELSLDCTRCSHQNGGHTRGGRDVWWSATGGCAVPGCPCPGRTNDPAARPAPTAAETPVAIAPPEPVPTRLMGPCGHGTGPCGATPTRPYACGPLCAEHAPEWLRRPAPPSP